MLSDCHALYVVYVPSLVLIAQAVFLYSADTQTDTHTVTDATDHATYGSATGGVRYLVYVAIC